MRWKERKERKWIEQGKNWNIYNKDTHKKKHHWGVGNTKSAACQTDYLTVTPQAPQKEVHCMLFSPQTELDGSDDTASRVPGLKRPVEQRQATPELITPQRHEENHSAEPHTHIHREHRLILFHPRLWWQRLFNESREVFKPSCVFHSPFSIPFESKISISPQVNQWQKLIWIDLSDFYAVCAIVQILTFWCADTFHHLICMPAMPMFVWSDICKRTEAINAVAGNGTCSDSLYNWTDTIPLQFVEHSFTRRDDRR